MVRRIHQAPQRLCATILVALLLMAGAAEAQVRKVALVIGNAAYREAPLKNPVNDARAMAARLRQLGFQVIAKENATRAQMEQAVADFGEALSAGAVGMFYYAGHGLQVNGRNFLVPVDAAMRAEQRVRLETLDVDIVLDQMDAARSAVNLVVLDACRNNPFERRLRATGEGLAQINAPQGTLIAYATAPGKVAADGEGANGVYTARLLQHMGTPGLPIEELFKRVRVDVSRETNGAQTPWESSSLTSGFFFVEPAPAAAPAAGATPAPAAPMTLEQVLWDAIKDANNPAMLQIFLDRYPNGTYAQAAQAKLAALRPPPAPAPAAAPPPIVAPAPAAPPAAPPVQQAAAPVPTPAPPPSTTAPSELRDGLYAGKGGNWTVEMTVIGERVAGKARTVERTWQWQISGEIDAQGRITGIVNAPQASSNGPLRISGLLPVLEIEGVNGGRVLLERRSGGRATPAAVPQRAP